MKQGQVHIKQEKEGEEGNKIMTMFPSFIEEGRWYSPYEALNTKDEPFLRIGGLLAIITKEIERKITGVFALKERHGLNQRQPILECQIWIIEGGTKIVGEVRVAQSGELIISGFTKNDELNGEIEGVYYAIPMRLKPTRYQTLEDYMAENAL